MKLLSAILFTSFLFTTATWKTNFQDAKTEASKSNKYILVNFSGSDWCLPCIQLKKKIFESESFNSYATENLVLLNADFPRQSKHKLASDQKKQNEDLAGKYDPEGKFPYTLLINADGKIIKQWDGLPDVSPDEFIDQVKQAINAHQ
jgi:thioredoxin-related protein